MTVKNLFKQSIISTALLAAFPAAHAAGFALIENSASGMGNAFAGAAAIAEDASTVFFNPAGMTYIEGSQVMGAIHFIKPRAEFNNDGSVGVTGNDGGDAGDLALVPNFYWVTNINEDVKFGLGVNAPFGLKTEYDDEWLGRFQAVKSELKTVNINPSLAFKVNDQLSLGFGLNAMYIKAELTSQLNFGPFGEGGSKVEGDDWGFGFNLGAIYQATQDTRIGVAYRSKVKQRLEGDVKFDTPATLPAPFRPNEGDIKAGVDLPETLSLSLFSRVNSKWDVMTDVTWTRWSNFEELRINRDNGQLLSLTPENWENTMRYSIGANYHYNDNLILRGGLAYDEEAINTEYRTARIPGNDRKWLSLGLGYAINQNTHFDLGYSHLFVSDPKIDDNQLLDGNGRLTGKYENSVDILSVQLSYSY